MLVACVIFIQVLQKSFFFTLSVNSLYPAWPLYLSVWMYCIYNMSSMQRVPSTYISMLLELLNVQYQGFYVAAFKGHSMSYQPTPFHYLTLIQNLSIWCLLLMKMYSCMIATNQKITIFNNCFIKTLLLKP